MAPSRKPVTPRRSRRPRRPRAVEPPPPELATEPPTVEAPPSAPGECNPWGAAAVRVPYRDGYILAAPGTDPAPLIAALDEHGPLREWAALGAELAELGPHHLRLAVIVARAAVGLGVSPEEEDQLTRILASAIARAGGVSGAIAWLVRAALREERAVVS